MPKGYTPPRKDRPGCLTWNACPTGRQSEARAAEKFRAFPQTCNKQQMQSLWHAIMPQPTKGINAEAEHAYDPSEAAKACRRTFDGTICKQEGVASNAELRRNLRRRLVVGRNVPIARGISAPSQPRPFHAQNVAECADIFCNIGAYHSPSTKPAAAAAGGGAARPLFESFGRLAGALHSNACMRRTGPSAAERATGQSPLTASLPHC